MSSNLGHGTGFTERVDRSMFAGYDKKAGLGKTGELIKRGTPGSRCVWGWSWRRKTPAEVEEKETRGKPCIPLSCDMGAKTIW